MNRHIKKQISLYLLLLLINSLVLSLALQSTLRHQNNFNYPKTITSSSTVENHWYAVSIAKEFVAYTAKEISVELAIPNRIPNRDKFYYVLLSCFDDNDSYDQIGIVANWSAWKITFSWSEIIETGPWPWDREIIYHTNFVRFAGLGKTYLSKMTVKNGIVYFQAFYKESNNWVLQVEKSYRTGGNYFVVTQTYYYKYWFGHSEAGFTDYEEFWYGASSSATPSFDFDFVNTKIVLTNGQSFYFNYWQEMYAYNVPPGVKVSITENLVYIDNP